MNTKKQDKKNFFKKNAYYFIIAFVMLTFITVTVILFINQQKLNSGLQNSALDDNQLNKPNSSVEIPTPDSSTFLPEDNLGNQPAEPDSPTQTVISFVMPVENATLSCDYTEASLVYNQTLNVYTGHLALDFKADYGAEVVAVWNGTVESITTSYLTGTTIVIDHGNGLKTVYNSVEAVEGLQKGMKVDKGQLIAHVSDNNRQEYKDGPHLHFEVLENGEKTSPYKYLTVSEK